MIQSMTGYGAVVFEDEMLKISVEIKSLNSKFSETTLRLPRSYSEKEVFVRNRINSVLGRGKIFASIELHSKANQLPKMQLNKDLVLHYYEQMRFIALDLGEPTHDLLPAILRLPDVINLVAVVENPELDAGNSPEQNWDLVLNNLDQALEACVAFRIQEGQALASDLKQNIHNISDLLAQISLHDPSRIASIRQKMTQRLETVSQSISGLDQNRFEQELIYYLEKLDINEEKIRLSSHLNFFLETLETGEQTGKKLGFIAQEIGREINTIGSKVSEAHIQRMVVEMKEELEKIKEQSLNVL